MGPALILFLSACDLGGPKAPAPAPIPPTISAPVLPPPPGSVQLSPSYPDGRFVMAEVTTESKVRVRAAGSSRHSASWRATARVGRDEAGRATVTSAFGDYAASGFGADGRYRFDSAAGEAIPAAAPDITRVWTALRGLEVRATLDDHGELLEVAGLEALQAAALAAVEGPMSGARRLALAEVFSDPGYQRAISWYSGYLTAAPVLPGDQWSDAVTFSLPYLSDVEVPRTFTLKRLEQREGRDIAVVGFEGELDSTDKRIRRVAFSGQFHFDLDYGEVTYEAGSRTLEMTVSGISFDARSSYEITAEIIDPPGG